MNTIRLIREELKPTGRGPGNGMYALQHWLKLAELPWLKIGGEMQDGEIPWVWCWLDKHIAVKCEIERRPFILGPCIFFADAESPATAHAEKMLLDSAHCKLMITESCWYADLIEQHRGPRNKAPLVLSPFPIHPMPAGPLEPEYELLIYAKSGWCKELIETLQRQWPRNRTLYYGQYRRRELIEAARRSRCCAYLSVSDRGPLALAEIMLSGCPAVGVARGSPWIVPYVSGVMASTFDDPLAIAGAVADCIDNCSRERTRAWASGIFSGVTAANRILSALKMCALLGK